MSTSVNILLVEDNPGDALLVRELLKEVSSFPYVLVHAETLAKAAEILGQSPLDVVLLDFSLPDGQGMRLIQSVADADPDVPIVIFTGLDDENVGLEAVREGAQDYLVKGQIDGRVLIRTIRHAIERKRMQIEREKLFGELQDLFKQVKTLRGLLPMCAWCKKIRDTEGQWVMLETYIVEHSSADVSHGICPECAAKVHSRVAPKV
jgi:DNA-binding NarL/FixJ family response regulator